MNSNLSQQQTKGMTMPSMNKLGAMPIKTSFDGPAPIKTPASDGVMQPGKNISIPKPGFF